MNSLKNFTIIDLYSINSSGSGSPVIEEGDLEKSGVY